MALRLGNYKVYCYHYQLQETIQLFKVDSNFTGCFTILSDFKNFIKQKVNKIKSKI